MSRKVSRRQLFQATGLSVGTVIGLGAIDGVNAGTAVDNVRFGVVVGAASHSGQVTVRLDKRFGGGITTARGRVLNRNLSDGDRVAIDSDSQGDLVASPLFTALTGTIERRDEHQMTVGGKSCSIDGRSTVRDAQNGERAFDANSPAQGQAVAVLCLNNLKSGSLTVATVYPA